MPVLAELVRRFAPALMPDSTDLIELIRSDQILIRASRSNRPFLPSSPPPSALFQLAPPLRKKPPSEVVLDFETKRHQMVPAKAIWLNHSDQISSIGVFRPNRPSLPSIHLTASAFHRLLCCPMKPASSAALCSLHLPSHFDFIRSNSIETIRTDPWAAEATKESGGHQRSRRKERTIWSKHSDQ